MENTHEFQFDGTTLVRYTGSAETVSVPDGVTAIGDRAFEKCHALREVYIPDSVTNLGRHPFNWCKNITRLRLPDHLLHGATRSVICSLFTEHSMNEQGVYRRLMLAYLSGEAVYTGALDGFCRSQVTELKSRFVWVMDCISSGNEQGLERILSHNETLYPEELGEYIARAREKGQDGMLGLLTGCRAARYTPEEIAGAEGKPLFRREDPPKE